MTITVQRLTENVAPELGGGKQTSGFVIVIDHHSSMEQFQQLVQRGTNLWPDATPEIKEFADKITNNLYGADGAVMQDYKAQDTSAKKKCIHEYPPLEEGIFSALALVRCIKCNQIKRS